MKIRWIELFTIILILILVTLIWMFIWREVYTLSSSGFNESIASILSFVQIVAIVLGGLLAYKKLILNKMIDSAVKVKASLMLYEQRHSLEAAKYRSQKDIIRYKTNMLGFYNSLVEKIHLAVLPNGLRANIFDAIFLTISANKESIDSNWTKFGKDISKIYKKLDDVITY